MLRKEYYGQQSAQERRIAELEAILNEKNSKLETYERLEQELDDVVMQAADGKCLFKMFYVLYQCSS